MARRTRDLYLIILLAVLANSLLWLDSLDRYLNGRYHLYLSQYLPEQAFTPSRVMLSALEPDEPPQEPAITLIATAQAAKLLPSAQSAVPVALPLAVASAVQPASAPQAESALTQLAAASAVPAPVAAAPAVEETGAAASAVPAVREAPAMLVQADSEPKVLFAGDSMMQGVAPMVISRMRKDHPKGTYLDLSKPSTGLVARRYFDWPTRIREESLKHGIQVIVMFLGPNDPWDIYAGKKRYAFPSDAWEAEYRNRVDEVLDFARVNGMRVIWIGLPVMREERIKQGAKIENRIFQEEVEKYKFDYLPTEDFLGNLDDPYSKYIDDPKKGKQAVRLDDGVHFTMLGLHMISARLDAMLREEL